ncbi:tail fiber domain-containing protein [bacterium]|nr:tail fiber domain-containing protein [bacterium]
MADIKIDSDSGKFKAGADQDLEVYNDGSHSYISGVTASQNMVFATRPSGGSTTTAVTIESDGTVSTTGAFQPAGNVTCGADLTVNGGDVTISNSGGHAYLNIDSHSNEASDSAIAFRSGTTERGYIYYDHNATAASQKMVFNVGDNAVTAMTILGDGNVTFAGNITIPAGNAIFLDGGGDSKIEEFAANKINIQAGGDSLIIDGSGSSPLVGIGTPSPSTPLEVHAESGGSTYSIAKFDLNTIDFPRAGTFRIGYGNSADYDLSVKQSVASGLVKYSFDVRNNGTDYANNLVLDRGNVGIGTTSPAENLHIKSSAASSTAVKIEATASNQRADLQFYGKYTGADQDFAEILFVNDDDSVAAISSARDGNDGNGSLKFITQSASGGQGMTTRMTIEADGTVQIPGTCSIQGITETKNIRARDNDSYDIGTASKLFDDIYATNGTIQTSDARLKESIEDSKLGLDFLNKHRPVSYKQKGKTRRHYGLIAQEVEKVLVDNSISTEDFAPLIKDNLKDDNDVETGESIYGMRYTEYVGILIKAVQELSAKVEALENA